MVAAGAGGGGGPYGERGAMMLGAGRVMSTESLSSGYGTDQYLPVETESLDTEDYELWERRFISPQPPPVNRQRDWRQPASQVGTLQNNNNNNNNNIQHILPTERGGDIL